MTVTPGISTGYCIARKRPARARSSTVIASTSSPSRRISPSTTWYFGWPAIVYARVDLPEPFGPMIGVDLALVDDEVDAAEDLAGALVGLDVDVQVLDLEH